MGWLWASPSEPSTLTQQKPTSGSSTTSTTPATVPPPAPSTISAPNEPVDPEIQKFFDLFTADTSPPPKPSPEPSATTAEAPSTSWFSLKANSSSHGNIAPPPDAPPLSKLSEALLPSTMSCRQAFDAAWACNSLGGQWTAVYRDGAMRGCSEQWDDFWFCMRTKGFASEMRERAVRQHYRNKEHAKYGEGKPSSEDVWEAREKLVEPGTAFAQRVDITPVDDDEWRRLESERRRKIRESLGYEETST